MGRLLTLTGSNFRASVRRETFWPQIKIGSVSLTFVTIIIACLLALLYLAFSNQVAAKVYKINSLEERKSNLLLENENLQVEAARLQSIKELENTINEKELVPTNEVNYVYGESNLAQK